MFVKPMVYTFPKLNIQFSINKLLLRSNKRFTYNRLQQQTFAQSKICVWEVSQSFQQNLACDIRIELLWIKLVQL